MRIEGVLWGQESKSPHLMRINLKVDQEKVVDALEKHLGFHDFKVELFFTPH
jgi:hypothetical protein